MTPLSSLRLDPRDEAEISWYFSDAQGELGLRAINYEPSFGGDEDARDAVMVRQMAAAERHRRIAKTLDRCPRWAVRVLQRWVCDGRWPPELRLSLGRYAGLASLTELGASLGVDGVRHVCRHGVGVKADDIVRHRFAVLQGQTQALLGKAVYEFGQAKPRRRAG